MASPKFLKVAGALALVALGGCAAYPYPYNDYAYQQPGPYNQPAPYPQQPAPYYQEYPAPYYAPYPGYYAGPAIGFGFTYGNYGRRHYH